MTDAYLWTIDQGIVAATDYARSYNYRQGKCVQPDINVTKFYNKGANEEDNVSNDHLKARLVQQPVGAAFYSDMRCLQHYKSGVIMAEDCDPNCSDPDLKEVNHAITIVGFGLSERAGCDEYWLVKNSWGENWGD